MSDSKYNLQGNKVCDTISHLQSLSIEHSEKQPPNMQMDMRKGVIPLYLPLQDKLKLNTHDNFSLRVRMTEQNKTIGQIRSQSSKKYNLTQRDMLGTGCIRHCFVSGQNPGHDMQVLPNALIGHPS